MSALSGECCLKGGEGQSPFCAPAEVTKRSKEELHVLQLELIPTAGLYFIYQKVQSCIDELLRLIDLNTFN